MRKDLWKAIVRICIPIAIQNLIAFFANSIDTVMIGQLSPNNFSAVNLANQVFFNMNLLIAGIVGGGNVLAAQYWGNKNRDGINDVISYSLRLSLISSFIFWLLAQLAPEFLMSLFTNDPELIYLGARYLKVVCYSYILFAYSTTFVNTLRSMRNVKAGMVFSSLTLIINAFLNYCLIFGNLGFPELGLEGAALATVIARVVEFICLNTYLLKFEKELRVDFKKYLHWNPELRTLYFRTSLPVIGNETVWGLGESIVVAMTGRLSQDIIFAVSVYNVVVQISSIVSGGINSAASVLTGNELGAGEDIRPLVKGLHLLALVMGIINGTLVGLSRFVAPLFYTFNENSLAIFNSIIMVGIVIEFFRVQMTINNTGILRGIGDVRFIFFNDMIFLWAFTIPVSYLCLFHTSFPFWVSFFCMKSDQILKLFSARLRVNWNLKKGVKALINN